MLEGVSPGRFPGLKTTQWFSGVKPLDGFLNESAVARVVVTRLRNGFILSLIVSGSSEDWFSIQILGVFF